MNGPPPAHSSRHSNERGVSTTLRISLVINSLGAGGAQGVCVSLANGLAARGHDVEVLVLSLDDAPRLDDLCAGVRVVDLGVGRARYALRAFRRHFSTHRPDVVLVFVVELWLLLAVLRWLGRWRFSLVVRNINFLSEVARRTPSGVRGTLIEPLLRSFYRRADGVVAQSRAMATDLRQNYRIPEGRLAVIPNPVAPGFLTDIRHPTPLPVRRYFLFAGRLIPQKNPEALLTAFQRIAERSHSVDLVFMGTGDRWDDLHNRTREAGLEQRVRFVGYQSNPLPWYQNAEATVLTSHHEGLPNVLIESIAVGTPVVSFDCPSGPSEIIVDGVNGHLVPQGDIRQLADAMIRILDVPLQAEKVRATSEPFRPDTVVDCYERLLARQAGAITQPAPITD